MYHETRTKTQDGFTLFYAVLASSLLLAIGLAIFNITYKELILSSGARESAAAFYAADAGLECALFWDLKHTTISSPAFGFYGDSLASGLQAYWRFNEASGDDVFDVSGGGHHGELQNMSNPDPWIDGPSHDSALTFDGVDDFIDLGDVVTISQGDDFTLSLWHNATNDGVDRMVVGGDADGQGGDGKIGFSALGESGKLYYYISIDGQHDNNKIKVDEGWHNLILVRNDGYVDLIIDDDDPVRLFNNNPENGAFTIVTIGAYDPEGSAQMHLGGLDDIRLYNRALSATEITETYNNGSNIIFTPPVVEDSHVLCRGADITAETSGWNPITSPTSATSSFEIEFSSGRCALVDVYKNTSTTTIVSRGYNTCIDNNPRRVERAIRAIY